MNEDRRETQAMPSSQSVETSDVEAMDTNKPSSPSSESLSTSIVEFGNDFEENDDESELSSSPRSSTSVASSSPESDHDFGLHFFVDDSSNDERNAEQMPEVLKKTLPIDKFSFVKALTERQCQADDVRRRLANRFDRQVYASRKLVQRLELHTSLQRHNNCITCVSFNDVGNVLISGSYDGHVSLWDWSRDKNLLYFGIGDVTTQAKSVPNSGDTKLVVCCLMGRIRLCTLDQCGLKSNNVMYECMQPAVAMTLQKQMPNTLLGANGDGVIFSIDFRDSVSSYTKLTQLDRDYTRKSLSCITSMHCNPLKNHEFIVCGDGRQVFLFDQRRITVEHPKPVIRFMPNSSYLATKQNFYEPYVTCSLFNHNGTEILSSYNHNRIYLFDAQSGKEVHCYDGHRNFERMKNVNFYGPRSEYIVSGSDCGHLFLWDKNSEAIVGWMKGDKEFANCVEPHPAFPILATSGSEGDVKIWTPTRDANDVEDIVKSETFRMVTEENCRATSPTPSW